MGGGTYSHQAHIDSGRGLSPRGRGNRNRQGCTSGDEGSIPAWAGEPPCTCADMCGSWVYPRVGGGTWGVTGYEQTPDGSIPAWAGEPTMRRPGRTLRTVYPRVGGGTPCIAGAARISRGLSPRGRGNRRAFRSYRPSYRSIPAWAGEPALDVMAADLPRVYPRVGGGTSQARSFRARHSGLSPRGRGNPLQGYPGRHRHRSIPAWAGEPAPPQRLRDGGGVYPRVGGGTRAMRLTITPSWGLSPRGRGNHDAGRGGSLASGSIPAWAGEPHRHGGGKRRRGVYPRVGGGTRRKAGLEDNMDGLSPRGRGNRCAICSTW